MNIREKMIIENELKFEITAKRDFQKIFKYLDEKYDVIPYKTANMYDYYYDTEDMVLTNNHIAFRIRYRPQISINVKLPSQSIGYIWSRYEYSSKIDGRISTPTPINEIRCNACDVIQKYLGDECFGSLAQIAIINSFRIGFNVYLKEKNVVGNKQLLGVAFFDTSINLSNNSKFMEFEMESYQQTDVYASPYIFDHFNSIGQQIFDFGINPSKESKLERTLHIGENAL